MYRNLAFLIVTLLVATANANGQTVPMAEQMPAADVKSQAMPTPSLKSQAAEDRTIQFSFDGADWKDVVSWIADQTGYSWQPISDWPEGTFTLTDDRKYTPLEALDQINYALRLRDPPYTIIRNRNQLILTDASSPLPNDLIENITVDQLDGRGDYEIVNCQFSLGEINVVDVEQDLRQAISPEYQSFAKVYPAANEFRARDTGAHLRQVRDTINAMTSRRATSFSTHTLKHYDPEQFMLVSRRLLDIPESAYQRDDGSLVIVVDPSSNRLILKGTPTAIEEFKTIADVVDVASNLDDTTTERPYLKSYPVFTDPEVARKVMETMLDGTDATVGQDAATGAIVLRGRKEHHKLAQDTIATLRGETGTTRIVQLQNSSASTILAAVQSLMNISNDAESTKGPKLLANTVQNYIVVRGTPAEIFETEQMIQQLDSAQQLDPDRVRTNARVVKMPPAKRDDLMEAVQDYWPATGRKNSLRIIMPEDRKKSIRGRSRFRSPAQEAEDLFNSIRNDSAEEGERRPSPRTKVEGSQSKHLNPSWFRSTLSPAALMTGLLTSPVQELPTSNGARSGEAAPPIRSGQDYTAPPALTSVPGSPVTIKGTAFGILIESDDLDALDDLENMLMQEAGSEGTDQGLSIFYLKYKKAALIKAALESMFGLSSGSSGGGGGDLLSGMVGNMAGGGAGDLLDGILGGSSSSASGAVIALEGDVQAGLYVPLNLIYISGATQSDLEIIQDAIEVFDQPSAPQDPELAGQFWSIQIRHRDPENVFALVQSQMAVYIQSEEQGNKEGGNAQEQVAKLVRNMAGGGGEESDPSQDLPTIRIDLDSETDQILITGPEFIYLQVLSLVERIDTPEDISRKTTLVLGRGQVTPSSLKILQQTFGKKFVVVDEDSDSADESKNEGDSKDKSKDTKAAQKEQADRAAQQQKRANDLFRNLRNAQGGGRGQGGGGGGRGQGGGGGGRGQGGGGGGRGQGGGGGR